MTLEKSTADPSELKQALSWRHDFHAHPELAFKERRTTAIVEAELWRFGLDVETGIGVTGGVGTLKGRQGSGPSIGLMSELDALPLNESDDIEYRSRTPGQMYACGHDGHGAILLETARRLAAKPDFRGAVHFIFQPAGEHGGGAKVMLDDGLLDRYPRESTWALHN